MGLENSLPTSCSEMFRIEEYSDKLNTYGVMIYSFESYERIKKLDEQERANNPEKPYDTVISNKL